MHEVLVKNEEFKDSPLGNIPKNWEISTIGEKAFISSGTTPSRSVATYWQNGRISWVKTGEVNYTLIQNTEEKVTQKALYETSLTLYPVGTVLVAMYGQFKDLALGRIPQKWTVKEFGEYIAHLDSGWSPICEAEPVANGEWGVLKTTAVVWSGYNPSESKKLPSNLEPRYSAVVETDDILITRKGPRERVGVVVHIPSTPANLMMPDTVFRVRLKESSPLLPAFIPLTLGSIAVQQDWNRKKVGLAEAQVDINYGIVRETIIYIPPKSEQKYIIQILNTYDTRIRTEEAYLNKLKLQKQGLMQDLLTGKVRLNSIK
ncbi:restriction endonuclease subunit S [Nostoc sp.]